MFISQKELAEAKRKGGRAITGPKAAFRSPPTAYQEYGWETSAIHQKVHPKKSCAETLYADAMVKSGHV